MGNGHTLFGFPVGGGAKNGPGGKKPAGTAPQVAARSRSLFGFGFGPAPTAADAGEKPARSAPRAKRSTSRTGRSTPRTLPAGVDAAYDDVNRSGRGRSRRR